MNDQCNDDEATDEAQDRDGMSRRPPTVLGWTVRFLSIGLLLLLTGVIIYEIARPQRDIGFTVEMQRDKVMAQNGQVLVPVVITNTGTDTARALEVEIDAGGDEPVPLTIPLLGQNESITLVLDAPSVPDKISYRVVSYEAP